MNEMNEAHCPISSCQQTNVKALQTSKVQNQMSDIHKSKRTTKKPPQKQSCMHLQLHLKLQVMSLKQKQQYAYGLNVCEMLSDYFLSGGGGIVVTSV